MPPAPESRAGRSASALCTALAAVLLFAGGCDRARSGPPAKAGRLAHPGAAEASGLAASNRSTDLFWTHGDSHGQPVLFAIGKDGRLRGSVRIPGIKNIDWEDVSSFKLDGRSWLLIADTGDNNGRRNNCSLIVISEPDPTTLAPGREVTAAIEWTIPVAYPDSPHDCEAVAVDAQGRCVYLVTKRTVPPQLLVLPLAREDQVAGAKARLVGQLAGVPQPTAQQKVLPFPTGRYRGQVTGLTFSPDGCTAAVLTYGDVLLYTRRTDEDWPSAFARPPRLLPPHELPQAEAISFSSDGRSLYVTGEEKDPVLRRYRLPASTR